MAERPVRGSRDAFGSVLGVLVFLGGVALMLLVFGYAYQMFNVPPRVALGLESGKAIDLNQVGPTLISIVVRIMLLVVMGLIASLVANRGISLYTASRGLRVPTEMSVVESPSSSDEAEGVTP